MDSKRTPRDKQWDEPDTTDDQSLMPIVDGPISLPKDSALDLHTGEGDCTERMEESRVVINELVDEQPSVYVEDGKIIVPVVKEKMVMVKKLVVVEEIHLQPVRENCDEDEAASPASGDLPPGGPEDPDGQKRPEKKNKQGGR